MQFWVYIAVQIVSALVMHALRPTPKAPEPQRARIPTAEDGKAIVEVFGDVWIDDANLLWYGDERAVPIKSKGKK